MDELKGFNIKQQQPVRTEEGEDLTREVSAAVDALDGASYIRELTDAIAVHISLQQISATLLHDEKPRETLGRMMEILIQKDEKWLNEEAGNDTRVIFFSLALRRLADFKIDYKAEATMQELTKQRHNDSFLSAIVAMLPEIALDTEHLGKYLESNLRNTQSPPSAEDILADAELN